MSYEHISILSGLTVEQLKTYTAILIKEGVVRKNHKGLFAIREASCMVTGVDVCAMNRFVASIQTTESERARHQLKLAEAVEAAKACMQAKPGS